ncbi:MAG: hypothetical protein A3B99_04725 [Candidatus Yanofskybacteria bacterium RIFCSPHIGHO2_02_FULL_44_12b]|uniref:Uncharacterized protein n=2 Tax=Candidatus Yanofskyibacteriota TaxID=1752733 RepID=A0A1F8GKA6_9BACT|nr:MAG: hypothetical protein UW79_C0003G0013 [Candidatus Yanofskybacteria bacterium GW2011_GWA2_44_9]OGN04371.1 MAG: hypothetical protein A2659_03525 [Candidatus Yanofskybacteria bacterium RIFCSPHIGHO2_01_FULL_44_24]OGN14480.1 MAG: hypothetical protein A3B99_04725 [Candidatus Yanofskybacteria bacterium RIFCSPHIGHO2_02_FULL_44_12b]OGN25761.1 MAG: hypothetical protein A2925_01065 [Candidatus Yanofskybacteria bacterium RIFCSPLOWO2_01_FULL_44_22]
MLETPSASIEQDIANLEKELQEKRALLEHKEIPSGGQAESVKDGEKEVLKSILEEKISQHVPAYQNTGPASRSSDDSGLSYLDPELKAKVDDLVKMVFDTNLEDGIRQAAKENNPALMDAFHAILCDELYVALIEKRKLDKID